MRTLNLKTAFAILFLIFSTGFIVAKNAKINNLSEISGHKTTHLHKSENTRAKPGLTAFGCPSGVVRFFSQGEVNSFPSSYPGCTELPYDLILYGDDISDLSPLSQIVSVKGDLHILFTYISHLDGFDNLKNVGGSLIISSNEVLATIGAFDSLQSVHKLQIDNNPSLESIGTFSALDANTLVSLNIFENGNLQSCNLDPFCEYLSGLRDRIIVNNGPNCSNLSALMSNCGIVKYCTPQVLFGSEVYHNYIRRFTTSNGQTNIYDPKFELSSPFNFSRNGYADYTDYRIHTAAPGDTVNFQVGFTGNSRLYLKIFIDWNQDLIFDESEIVAASPTQNTTIYVNSFKIPDTTPEGEYRMRISGNTIYSNTTCEDRITGEVEDYTLIVEATSACKKPFNLEISEVTRNSVNLSWKSSTEPQEFFWQLHYENESPENGDYLFSGTTENATLSLFHLAVDTKYTFYVKAKCGDDYSNWTKVRFTTKPSYKEMEIEGMNQDVIANGTGIPSGSTTIGLDGTHADALVFYNTTYNYNNKSFDLSLPANGKLLSAMTRGLSYQLAPANSNNAILLLNGERDTVNFDAAIAAKTVFILGTSTGPNSNVYVEVVFEDGSKETKKVLFFDWMDYQNQYAVKSGGKVARNATSFEADVRFPRMHEVQIDLQQQNVNKKITKIIFNRGNTQNSRAHIMAITIEEPQKPCEVPGNLEIVSIAGDTVKIKWEGSDEILNYEWSLTEAGDLLDSLSAFESTSEKSIVLQGLKLNTSYEFYLRGHCELNGVSDLQRISFHTGCPAFTIKNVVQKSCVQPSSIEFDINLPDGTFDCTYTKDGETYTVPIQVLNKIVKLENPEPGTYTRFSVNYTTCDLEVTTNTVIAPFETPTLEIEKVNMPTCDTNAGINFNIDLEDGTYNLSYIFNDDEITLDAIVENGAFLLDSLSEGNYTDFSISYLTCSINLDETVVIGEVVIPTLAVGQIHQPGSCGGEGSVNFITTLPDDTYTLTYRKGVDSQTKEVSVIGGVFELDSLLSGTYSDFSISHLGCLVETSDEVTLADPVPHSLMLAAIIQPLACGSAGSIEFTTSAPNGAYTVSYQHEAQSYTQEVTVSESEFTLTSLSKGSYDTISLMHNGCTAVITDDLIITDPASPLAPKILLKKVEICTGTEVTLVATCQNAQVKWHDGSIGSSLLVSPMVTTNYTAKCVNEAECESEESEAIEVTVNLPPQALVLTSNKTGICVGGGEISLTATGNCQNYQWSTGETTGSNSLIILPEFSTVYQVICVSENGCTSEQSNSLEITVNENNLPLPLGSSLIVIESGAIANLSATCTVGEVVWYDFNESKMGVGASYTTLPLIQNTTFRVRCENNPQNTSDCKGAFRSVEVVINNFEIVSQPESIYVCHGQHAYFQIGVTGLQLSYQWQIYDGSNWVSVQNGGKYNGSTTNILTIHTPGLDMNDNKYRCVVTESLEGIEPKTLLSSTAILAVHSSALAHNLSVVSNMSNTNRLLQAVQTITGTSKITGQSNIRYFAGNSITLEPGFEVVPGSIFTAKIQLPCINTSFKDEEVIPDHIVIDKK